MLCVNIKIGHSITAGLRHKPATGPVARLARLARFGSMTSMGTTHDLCHDILEFGWSPSEARCREEDGATVWQVDATRFDDGRC